MKNYREFRKWCAKNSHGLGGEASERRRAFKAHKLAITALCCSLLAGGYFGINAFGSSVSDYETTESSSSAQTVTAYTEVSSENEYASSLCIGASVSELSEAAIRFGLPQGAAIEAVTEGSPAAEAGIQSGDIITAVNGEAVSEPCELTSKVEETALGSEITFSVYRQGSVFDITVKVCEEQPDTECRAVLYSCEIPDYANILV